jgi:cell division protein FtsQ
LSYRLSRAWAKPILRNAVLVYLPLVLLAIAGWRIAAHDGLRGMIEAKVVDLGEQFAARPEFAVRGVTVTGGSDELNAEVRRALDIQRGISSLNLDVERLRLRTEALGAVETATVQFDPQGTLRVAVVERIAVALFRRSDRELVMVDKGGVVIGPAGSRANHPELPVILGAGGQDRVDEVLDLLAAAPEIMPRLRAFVRVGERRWDIVLDRDMVIKLPQTGSVEALSRIMALHYGEELLDRDIAVIDMRLPDRPAVRMMPEAANTYQIRRAVAAIGGEDT